MFKMERILLASDFSAGATQASAYASFFASAWNSHLDLLHVIPLWPDVDLLGALDHLRLAHIRQEIGVKLESLVSQMRRTGVRAQAHQDEGIPSERIVAAAATHKSDLVVVGSHGHSELEHVLLGSTAERVVKGAPCPVLTVRTHHLGRNAPSARESTDAIRMRRILLATDLSEWSLPAVDYALQAVRTFNASVTILHVMEWRSLGGDISMSAFAGWEKLRESVETRLLELTERVKSEGAAAQCVIRVGLPADLILEVAQEQTCDLIVMGTHGRRGVSHLLLGSVAEAVLRRADCPVLTVKHV
ncbi:MAG: universal stress protein [Nitrospira sp.]|nr:universal stress protein [Nitrospira sp.]